MINKILTYPEAINLINNYLKKVENLSEFYRKNKLDYQSVLHIKNKKTDKQYPNTLKNLLELYIFDAKIERTFRISCNEKF